MVSNEMRLVLRMTASGTLCRRDLLSSADVCKSLKTFDSSPLMLITGVTISDFLREVFDLPADDDDEDEDAPDDPDKSCLKSDDMLR